MNIKDFKWTEKRFGSRFANILKNLCGDTSDESSPIEKLAGTTITDLEQVLKVIKTQDDTIEYLSKGSFGMPVAITTQDYDEPTAQAAPSYSYANIKVYSVNNINVGDFLIVMGVFGYELDGTTSSARELILRVLEITANTNTLKVEALNGKHIGTNYPDNFYVPSIPAGTTIKSLGGKVDPSDTPLINFINDSEKTVGFRNFELSVPYSDAFSKERGNKLFNVLRDSSYFLQDTDNKTDYYFKGLFRSAGAEYVLDDEWDGSGSFEKAEYYLIYLMGEVYSSMHEENRTKLVLCNTRLMQGVYAATGGSFIMKGFGCTFVFVGFETCDTGLMDGFVLDIDDVYIYCKEPKKVEIKDDKVTITETSTIVMNTPKRHCRIVFV